ncbi:hypothetical protein ACQJBY_035411 [Aegilops geniculata]
MRLTRGAHLVKYQTTQVIFTSRSRSRAPPFHLSPRRRRRRRRPPRHPGAMLRLRGCVLSQILSSSSASPVSHLSRLISAAAPAIFPNPSFAVEEYLVSTCGLTRPQAVKASAKLSHLKSPAKPDAVLAFLAGLGLSAADVAAVVAKDPLLLCAKVEKTLAPVVDGLTGLGLSRPEIAHLVSVAGEKFRCRAIVYRLHYYLALFGSAGKLLREAPPGARPQPLHPLLQPREGGQAQRRVPEGVQDRCL